jgi:hypothetical protein
VAVARGIGADSMSRADSAERQQRDTAAALGKKKKVEGGDSLAYAPSDSIVSTRVGLNRFAWNLRPADVRKAKDIIVDFGTTAGPMVPPGTYTARLTVSGHTYSQPFSVVNDPRSPATPADLQAQAAMWGELRGRVNAVVDAAERIETMQKQLDARTEQAKGQPYAARVQAASRSLRGKLEAVRSELVEVHAHADEITLHFPVKIYNQLLTLNSQILSADAAPTASQRQSLAQLGAATDAQLAALRTLEAGEVTAFNKMIRDLDVPAVTTTSAPARAAGAGAARPTP